MRDTDRRWRHPNDWDLYTPITPELLQHMVRMRDELGSWREVAAAAGVRTRILRRIYRMEVKSVSLTLMDKLCSTTEIGSVSEYVWFEAHDMVALGLWDQAGIWLDGRTERTAQRKKDEPRVKFKPRLRND